MIKKLIPVVRSCKTENDFWERSASDNRSSKGSQSGPITTTRMVPFSTDKFYIFLFGVTTKNRKTQISKCPNAYKIAYSGCSKTFTCT